MQFSEIEGSEEVIPCDLAFLAIGYSGPKNGLLEAFEVEMMENGLPKSKEYKSSVPEIFIAGDIRRDQSLVVWAVSEGRECAVEVDKFLNGGVSTLPRKDHFFYSYETEAGVSP